MIFCAYSTRLPSSKRELYIWLCHSLTGAKASRIDAICATVLSPAMAISAHCEDMGAASV
jgi:mannose/fructose/N-acetylgalactosamine-specific phosphotransferase system component IIC